MGNLSWEVKGKFIQQLGQQEIKISNKQMNLHFLTILDRDHNLK